MFPYDTGSYLCFVFEEWKYEINIYFFVELSPNISSTNVCTYFCICRNYDSTPSNYLESFLAADGSGNEVIIKDETMEDISDIVDTGI